MRTLALVFVTPLFLFLRDAEAAPAARVEVCHRSDSGFQLISVAASAESAHRAHGDPATVTWYRDLDGDGYGDASASTQSCARPEGYTAVAGDCDDTLADVRPDLAEVCNGLDDDCDGAVDEDAADMGTWYLDADRDGYGDAGDSLDACAAPDGYVADDSDCEDDASEVHPGAAETCSPVDDDCDGLVNEPGASEGATWYADADGDGYGDVAEAVSACEAPAGTVGDGSDCDDSDAAVSPSAAETCDGVDQDCDGAVDEEALDQTTWFLDADGDGYGDAGTSLLACDPLPGEVAVAGDCDDADGYVSPDAVETCDGADEDCDGVTDEPDALGAATWYVDADGDGYGDPADPAVACEQPDGYVAGLECDDGSASVYPGATDVCGDGIDADCSGADATCDCPCWSAADLDAAYGDDGLAVWHLDGGGDVMGWVSISGDPGTSWTLRLEAADNGAGGVAYACGEVTWADDTLVATDQPVSAVEFDACDEVLVSWTSGVDGLDCTTDADGDGSTICGVNGALEEQAPDCADNDPNIGLYAAEVCDNGIDDDCDGALDLDDAACSCPCWTADDLDAAFTDPSAPDQGYYLDTEGTNGAPTCALAALDGSTTTLYDAEVVTDTQAQACLDVFTAWTGGADPWLCTDHDGDGVSVCGTGAGDCDDGDAAAFPGATEDCDDGVDDDCDGLVDGDDEDCACPCWDESALTMYGTGFQFDDSCAGTGADTCSCRTIDGGTSETLTEVTGISEGQAAACADVFAP